MSEDEAREVWGRECQYVREALRDDVPFGRQSDLAIEAAERLLAAAHVLAGVHCERCDGFGRRVYASTTLWRGGVGGCAMTSGPCDLCWGTGRRDRKGFPPQNTAPPVDPHTDALVDKLVEQRLAEVRAAGEEIL